MNRNFLNSTPVSSKSCLNSSKSLFHDFVRPRGQFAPKVGSSPFTASPQSEDLDFIPLSYSSPVANMNRRGSGGNWKGDNLRNFSPSNLRNSSFTPYGVNNLRNFSPSNLRSSSFTPYGVNNLRNFSPSNLRNSSFTPYSVNEKHYHRRSTSSNGNSSFAPYDHMDRPRNYSSDRNRRDNNFLGNMQISDDISRYYHPSMLEDPWAELEQKLRNSTPDKNCSLGGKHAREKSILYSRTVDSLVSGSDSDEGADSQGTDSSVVASDGSS